MREWEVTPFLGIIPLLFPLLIPTLPLYPTQVTELLV